MSISNNALIFYHTYTIESKKKSVYFTDFSIKTSFSLEYRDGFERLLGFDDGDVGTFSDEGQGGLQAREARSNDCGVHVLVFFWEKRNRSL